MALINIELAHFDDDPNFARLDIMFLKGFLQASFLCQLPEDIGESHHFGFLDWSFNLWKFGFSINMEL